MGLFGAAHGKKAPLSKPVAHIMEWWNLALPYLTQRRSKKYINHVPHPLSSAGISIFYQKSAIFVVSRNTDVDRNFFNFVWVFKDCFNKHGCNFDYTSKIDYSRPF